MFSDKIESNEPGRLWRMGVGLLDAFGSQAVKELAAIAYNEYINFGNIVWFLKMCTG